MMYFLEIAEEVSKQFAKLSKRDKVLFEAIAKKLDEIRENPHHYKPLRAPLQNKRRVHVGGSYVLIFSVEKQTVRVLDFEHHDRAYK